MLAVTQLGFNLTVAALPLYLHDLGAAQSRIGFEVGLGNMAGFLSALVLGPMLNRVGARRFLQAAGVIYVATAIGMLVLRQEAAVAACRALQGVGGAFVVPSAMTLAARLVPNRRGMAIGLLGALNSLAFAAAPAIGLQLYAARGATGMLVPAVGASALGLGLGLLVPSMGGLADRARGFGYDRGWTGPLIANGLAGMYFGGIVSYLPLTMRQVHGPNAGIFFSADALGVLLLRIPTGMLTDRRGPLPSLILGTVVTLPGIGALALAPSVLTLVIAGAGTGIGAGLFITGVYTELSNASTDSNRGTALALATGTFSGAIFVGAAVSGLLIGRGGFDAVLLFGATTTVAALPFVLVPVRRRPAE